MIRRLLLHRPLLDSLDGGREIWIYGERVGRITEHPAFQNTARMIARSDATVVPIYFDGHTSRLFQLASHLHYTLRLGLLINEFRARIGEPVRIVVGDPIPRGEIAARAGDAKAMMDFLRRTTYELSPKPLPSLAYGFEFEEKYRA